MVKGLRLDTANMDALLEEILVVKYVSWLKEIPPCFTATAEADVIF